MNASQQIDQRYAEQLHGAARSLGQLLIWTVYDHPGDYPDWYVARPSIIRPKTMGALPMHLIAKDLDTLRALLPNGLTRLARQPGDDMFILEVWV
jgi:hypothetical protein